MTNYLTTEYNVKYHITFTHDDGQDAVFYDDMVIECASPEDAQNIILEQYEFGSDALTDFPDDWFGFIAVEELEIDQIVKVEETIN